MDIIDGQHRFEVAHNLLTHGSPFIQDPVLVARTPPGLGGGHYSYYGIGAWLFGLPLVALGRLLGDVDTERFFFSWASGVAGAALCAVYFVILRRLEVARRPALAWPFVFGF